MTERELDEKLNEFQRQGWILQKGPVRDDHPYNGKIIGWQVLAERGGRQFLGDAPTLFHAYEQIVEMLEEFECQKETP